MCIVLQVDDVRVFPDVSYTGFDITTNGRFVRVSTDYGMIVEFDGEWSGLVQIPNEFRSKVYGLCADADGNPADDLVTKEGLDVTNEDNVYTLIGESYQTVDNETWVLF